jgi:hypothetical protein
MSLITYQTRESTGQTAENFNLLFRKKKSGEDGTYSYLNADHILISLKFCLGLLLVQLSPLLPVPTHIQQTASIIHEQAST